MTLRCFCGLMKLGVTGGSCYGIRGIPPFDHTLMLSGKRYSIIATMSTDRVEDIYVHKDSINGDVFLDFVRKCLLPILMPSMATIQTP